MSLFSTVTDRWLGFCPKQPGLRTSTTILTDVSELTNPDRPDGGTGRPGKIILGMSFAVSGTKTLDHYTYAKTGQIPGPAETKSPPYI